jgi:ribosome-binding protein aMBF1 (putative translation factor)
MGQLSLKQDVSWLEEAINIEKETGCELINLQKISKIGTILKEARQVLNISVEDLSHKTGIDSQLIYRFERGGKQIRIKQLIHLVEKGFEGKLRIKITLKQ